MGTWGGPLRNQRVRKARKIIKKPRKNLEHVVIPRKSFEAEEVAGYAGPIRHKRVRKKRTKKPKRRKNFENIVIPRKSLDISELMEEVIPMHRRKSRKKGKEPRAPMMVSVISPLSSMVEMSQPSTSTATTTVKKKKKRRKRQEKGPTLLAANSFRRIKSQPKERRLRKK